MIRRSVETVATSNADDAAANRVWVLGWDNQLEPTWANQDVDKAQREVHLSRKRPGKTVLFGARCDFGSEIRRLHREAVARRTDWGLRSAITCPAGDRPTYRHLSS